jgi:alanyl-tRNA synthetase
MIVSRQDGLDTDGLLALMDEIKGRINSGVFLLASATAPDALSLVLAATKDVVSKGFHAGKTLGPIAKAVGGGGGGKPDMARAGGKDASALDGALSDAAAVIRKALAG